VSIRPTDVFRCPDCGGRLEAAADALTCAEGHRFPIVNGVPRFVGSELYVGNFGFEWNRHRQTQLDGPGSDESERTFRKKTGFTPADLDGRLVLDAGCGMGRFSDVASRWGATVFGVDLSSAVEAAHRNLGDRGSVRIAQADIFRLPFADATFDFVFSIGVLHHTPSTRQAFERLVRLVKPGGRIAIWLYHGYSGVQWKASNLLRRWTWRLPPRTLHALSHVAVPKYYVDRLPGIGLASRLLFPVSMHPKAEWRVLDTFDWYSPRYQWKHTYEEVFPWFEQQGLVDIRVLGVPVALQGRRPAERP
jgi:SAM-dependent methyltransferase